MKTFVPTYPNTIIIITGPTASGKTALSLQLAEHLKTSIISADSKQCYKELNIGVAKPEPEELQRIKHYFINSHSIYQCVTAQTFQEYALESAEEIFQQNNFAVMTGGSGLYIKAFCEGLDAIPDVQSFVRKEIRRNYSLHGLLWLQAELQQKDPGFWKIAEQQNPQRLMRALEVLNSTGRSILSFRGKAKKKHEFNIIKFGLHISKEQLHKNINGRVDEMMARGLVNEAELLRCEKHLPALQTVGYQEIFDFFEGRLTLSEAILNIKHNTRRYAKRQTTWFKKDTSINWLNAQSNAYEEILLFTGIKSLVPNKLKS